MLLGSIHILLLLKSAEISASAAEIITFLRILDVTKIGSLKSGGVDGGFDRYD